MVLRVWGQCCLIGWDGDECVCPSLRGRGHREIETMSGGFVRGRQNTGEAMCTTDTGPYP